RVRFTDRCLTSWWFGPHTKNKEGVIHSQDPAFGYKWSVRVGDRYALVDDNHIEPAPLTIESGKFYITCDGRMLGPATPSGDTDYPWWVGESTYTDSGSWVDGLEDDNDLVAEADESLVAEQWAGSMAGFTVP